jgi:hypothetical protein
LGYNALELVKFVENISKETERKLGKLKQFLEYIRILFPDVERLEVNEPTGGFPEKDVFVVWKTNGIERYQPLSRSGTGISNSLYMVSKLLTGYTSQSIAFIDEPENGLHPNLQIRFIRLLKRLSNDFSVQWLVGTHSPFIMQNLKHRDVLMLMEHNGHQSTCRQIDITQKQDVLHALGAYLPFMLNSNGVIFVEGATESRILSILLPKAGLDIDSLQIVIVPLGGENLFQVEPKDLKKIHEKALVIIDSDLDRPVSSGGSIKQSKKDYREKCKEADIKFVMPIEFRTLENMYPKRAIAAVLGVYDQQLTYDNYSDIPEIKDDAKVKIGEMVASEMTHDEAKEFPLVQSILEWWEQ